MNTYLVVYLIGVPIVFALTAMVGKKSDIGKPADWAASIIAAVLWPVSVTYGVFTALGTMMGLRK